MVSHDSISLPSEHDKQDGPLASMLAGNQRGDDLESRARELFQKTFNYKFDGYPPEFPKERSSALITRNRGLGHCAIDAHGWSTWKAQSYVDDNVMSGFNLPFERLKSDVRASFLSVAEQFFPEQKVKKWGSAIVDREFGEGYPAIVHASAVLVWWQDWEMREVFHRGTLFNVRFDTMEIYCMGAVYELKDAMEVVTTEVLEQLCRSLTGSTIDIASGETDKWWAAIDTAAENKFKSHFGFPYKQDPPDKKANTSSRLVSHLFQFDAFAAVTAKDIKEKIDREVFKRDETGFYHDGPEIYDNLLKALTDVKNRSTTNYGWSDEHYTPEYHFSTTDGSKRTLKEYSTYLYARGTLTKNTVRGQVTVDRFYIQWLGSFCITNVYETGEGKVGRYP